MKIKIRYISIVLILIIFLTTFFVESLRAKCPRELYIIKGKTGVRECCDCDEMEPVEDATIVVFLDNDSFGAIGNSKDKGYFEIPCFYDTFKGTSLILLGADRCGKKPSKLTIIVHAEGYFPVIKKIKIKKPVIKDNKKIFEIPPIIMRRISQTEIDWRNSFINYSSESKLDETGVDSHASRIAYPDAPDVTLTLIDKNSGIKIEVAQDGRHLFATDINGKELWRVDVIKAIEDSIVGAPVIRNISFSGRDKDNIHAIVGKHTFVDIDIASGNVKWQGSD